MLNAILGMHIFAVTWSDKHMKNSYVDSIFFKLFNDISFVTVEQYFLFVIVMAKYRTFL